MKATLFLILVSGLLVTSPPVSAHHSFAAEFDVDSPVELRGVLTKMEWVNPHGWLYIDVTQPDGTVVNWAIEAGGPNQLLRRGLRKTDFPIGLEVLVQGFAAKSGAAKANGQEITTADGRNFIPGRGQQRRWGHGSMG
ncbi:MAG: DUF6152 family protein [Acidobacteria bacterium]|nr:DUF6152 family protein [Acidobacteriota bacterium]